MQSTFGTAIICSQNPCVAGQRRKLRGSRALSASYHNRLRSCMLNEKGSPLPHSTRSFTNLTGGGQENTAPILFQPVAFGEHSKCWLGWRPSPNTKDASGAHSLQHQGATGITLNSSFPAHCPVLSTAADQSLLAAAALANSSRHDKQLPCGSPAPKGRTHRRSLSGASIGAASGLNDSAEALHGPSAEGCILGQGQALQPGGWPHPRGVSEGSAHRHVAAFKTCGTTNGDQESFKTQACVNSARDGLPNCLPDQSRSLSLTSSIASNAPLASGVAVARFGIAAFGVPASVRSCFQDSLTASTQHVVADTAAAAGPPVNVHELGRCTMSCPGDMCNVAAAVGMIDRRMGHCVSYGSFTGDPDSMPAAAAAHVSGPVSDLVIEPLADRSSEPLISGHMRHGTPFAGTGSNPGKALADSAEELELRRLTHQQPHSPTGLPELRQHAGLHSQQEQVELKQQQPSLRFGISHSRPTSTGSANAGTASAFGAAASEPLPVATLNPTFVPFDMVSLARSAGAVCFGTSDFMTTVATPGEFLPDALQTALDRKPPSSLWPTTQAGGSHNRGSRLVVDDTDNTSSKPDSACRTSAWLGSYFASNAPCTSPKTQAGPPDASAAVAAEPEAVEHVGDGGLPTDPAMKLNRTSGGSSRDPIGDVRCDQDDQLGSGDGEDGESWLRTSQQAPDPDDPSSAGKYSAVLLRRLQAAAEHEGLYGIASGDHLAACGFYHLQESGGSELSHGDYGLRSSTGRLHLGSHGSSSMEPSPLPRLSSRLRRLRVSPYLGAGGSSGPLTSPTPSLLLGTRSRSAGVTPGGATFRRLRRRSDLLMPDQLGQMSARGHADVDELEDSDGATAAVTDEHMHDVSHQFLAAGGSGGRLRLMAGRSGDRSAHAHRHGGGVQPLQPRHVSGNGLLFSAAPGLRSEPMQRMFSQNYTDSGMPMRVHSAEEQLLGSQHRLHSHTGDDFLNGLMDYEDEGVEYTTPPHTPLRGIGGANDTDATTAKQVALAPKPSGASSAEGGFFAIAPGRGRPGLGKGLLHQRVTFAAQRLGGTEVHTSSPPAAVGRGENEASCMQLLMSNALETTQDFNRCLALAATSNDRGRAERLWQEMCSRGVTPDGGTLNLLLRCLARSAADPDEAQLLAREVCRRGGFSLNATAQHLLEEICFRFEQLNGNTLTA
ncbi:hypothetical protein Vretimale_11824 [Volvox reticuliferus]|uniref:Pentacotripeptide-repeat region of PRORP domain-containing protein n=1 Tax=Volvox reticuliferus TaxID=1737510 RepID=A0A8J4GJ05_9CHLO|nr:hypothetical protein Vretifemale_11287 [Volvox reticuliferus]GIM07746.1 hypothetical protein Vretimale_11824 [Volvox reticuliferus]